MQIDVSLDVYKALTAKLSFEGQTYDDVIRDLLELDSPLEAEDRTDLSAAIESVSVSFARSLDPTAFYSRGLRLPHGTQLKARYKGGNYSAHIANGMWLDSEGNQHHSPSAAATAITGNNVNGLRFWEARRPGDGTWRRLDTLVKS